MFTYNVTQDLPADAKLVLTITDDTGRQIRRLDLDKTAGLRRVAWNLRGDRAAGATAGAARAGGGGGGGSAAAAVRRKARSSRPAATARRSAEMVGETRDADRSAADVLGRADSRSSDALKERNVDLRSADLTP